MSQYVYVRSEAELWTVGFYAPDGKWNPDGDYDDPSVAAQRVHWLNGGGDTELGADIAHLAKRVADLESSLHRTANIASCLANGIQPD